MNYKYTDYDNFDELMDCDSQTANLLLKELDLDESDIGKETWMNERLMVYPNVEEYAIYELIDGWYQNHNLGGSKQTGYVDGWAFDDIYVFQSVQDFALEYLHRGIEQKSVFINGRYRNIPDAIEYVDLDKFGNKLLDEFGDDSFQLLPNGKVVAIGCGW